MGMASHMAGHSRGWCSRKPASKAQAGPFLPSFRVLRLVVDTHPELSPVSIPIWAAGDANECVNEKK